MRPGQRRVVAGGMGIALLLFLHPPWRARAIRTTTRYAGAAGVAPAIVVDTVEWSLAFAPLYDAPPHRTPFTTTILRAAEARRSTAGDIDDSLHRVVERFERRYRVPELLRTRGSEWRDSVLATAGIPSVSAYHATFAIDGWRLAARLAVVAAFAAIVHVMAGRRDPNSDVAGT